MESILDTAPLVIHSVRETQQLWLWLWLWLWLLWLLVVGCWLMVVVVVVVVDCWLLAVVGFEFDLRKLPSHWFPR